MLMVTPNIVIRKTYTHTCAKYIVGRNVAGCITIQKKCVEVLLYSLILRILVGQKLGYIK